MSTPSTNGVQVALPADVHQIDETGYVWSLLEEAPDPERVQVGHVIVAGDADVPFLARVVDIVEGVAGSHVVHLDVLGVPDRVVQELRRARLLPTRGRVDGAQRSLVPGLGDCPHGESGPDRARLSTDVVPAGPLDTPCAL